MKHSMLKCLSLVLALATIAGVFAVPAFAVVNTCNHYAYEEDWIYIGTKDPTCTEHGGKVYECPNCDKQFVDSRDWAKGEYLPLDHDWKEVDRQDATLEEDGWVKYECERCDAEKTDPLSATKCPNNTCDYEVVNTATCTEAGKITKTCKVCGHKVEEDAPAKGHTWDDGVVVKAPICGVDENGDPNYGTIKFSCTVPGCNGTRLDETVLPASGSHKWEWKDAKATACGVAGNTAGYKCLYCDAAHPTEPYTVLSAPSHNLVAKEDDDHKNVALGCVDEVIWNQCTLCETWVDVSDRTATGVGGNHYLVWATTTVDGVEYKYTHSAKAATMEIIRAATCETKAVYGCTECDYTTKSATNKNHNFAIKQEPTCLNYGAYICSDCGAVDGYKDLDGNIINPELNKKPHEADAAGKTTVAPGCTLQGYDTYKCKWCYSQTGLMIKDNYTDPIDHDKVWTEAEEATCTEGGCTRGWVCGRTNCDAQNEWEPSTPTNPLTHDYQLATNLPANCTYGVHDAYVCTRCGLYDPSKDIVRDDRNADPTKHVWDPSKTLKTEPTCEKPGSIRLYCSVCYDEAENEIQPVHHSFEIVENGVVVGLKNPIGRVPATCTTPGFDVYYCTNENCDIAYGAGKFYTEGATHTVNNGTADVQVVFIHNGSYALDLKLQDRYDSHYAYVNYVYNPFADTPAFTTNFTGVAHDSDGKVGTPVGYTITNVDYCDECGKSKVLCQAANECTNPTYTAKATGSCAQASYLEYTCDDCHYRYNEKLSDAFGVTGQHVASDPIDKVGACNEVGYTGRVVCLRCAATLVEGTTSVAQHSYDKNNIVHPYSENKAPTCLEYGWAKDGWCTVCQDHVREGELQPTGHKIGNKTPAQVADCVLEGWDAHYNCVNPDCNYVLDNAAIAGLEGDALKDAIADKNNWSASIRTQGPNGYINGYTVALGHDMAYSGTVDYACLVDGYDYFECGRVGCDHVVVEDNFYFGFANHRYTDESLVLMNKAGDDYLECADSYLCCANLVPSANGNVACGDKKLVHEAEAHKNAANEVIKGLDTCANWDAAQDHVCKFCDVDFTFSKIHEFLGDYTTNSHEADCQNYKHDVNTCNVCGHIWIANVDDAAGYGDHRWVAIPGTKVEASFAAPGTEDFKCSLCGEEDTVETPAKEGVEFEIEIANKNEGQEIVDGAIIAVTIKTNAYKFGLTSLLSKLSYNKDLFTYVGFEANNAFGVSSSADQAGKTTVANAAAGVVTILSVSENYADGGLQNVELTGSEAYITLYFRVACGAYDSTENQTFALTSIDAKTRVNGNADVAVDAALIHNNDVEDLTDKIYQLGNINDDAFIGQEDIIALRSLLLVEGYEAVVAGAGDVNQDGDINLVDFSLLQQVIIGAITYEQLVASVA